MIGRMLRTYEAVADFGAQAREFGWVLALSFRSRYRR